MSALFRIVYATHANGTHHKLALDALNEMQHGDKDAWIRVFLKHVERYLEGSKAPDVSFKDFKNHVLHVAEGYWGGAPEKAEAWYQKTVDELRAGNWPDAVYAAGVLSHYYTDPVQPFHTGQTEAENAIHRAAEWSISRSYDTLRTLGEQRFADLDVPVPAGPNWLSEFVCDGAEFSHRYYEKLIAHYDIHKGSVRPKEGLDTIARGLVAELLIYASKGFGRVLDAAITEAGVAAPDVTLTAETFLAMTKIPAKFIEKRLTNAEDRKLVAAIYDELRATGRVDKTLPEDDRTIRDLHQREVLEPKLAQRSEIRAVRIETGEPVQVAANISREAPTAAGDTALELAVAKSAHIRPDVSAMPPAIPDAPHRTHVMERGCACAAAADLSDRRQQRRQRVRTARNISLPVMTSRRRRRSVPKWPSVSRPLGFTRSETSSGMIRMIWPTFSTILTLTLSLSLTGRIRPSSSLTCRG